MLRLSRLRFFLVAVAIVVSFPSLLLSYPVMLPMPQQWVGSGGERSKFQQSLRMLTNEQEIPTQRSHRPSVNVPTSSRGSSSDCELQTNSIPNSLSDEKNKIAAENRHMLDGLQSQNSPHVVARLSWTRSSIERVRLLFGRVVDMISVSIDHSQPCGRNTTLRRPSHDFSSRFIFSHEKEKKIGKKSTYESRKSLLNSTIHYADTPGSGISKPQTSEPFKLLDPEKNQQRMNKGRQRSSGYSPTTTSWTRKEIPRIGPSLSVSNYLKTTDAKHIAAAPCGSTKFWFPTVLRTLEREGVQLVFYCVDIGVSELDSQEIRTMFSGLSSLKLGGIITTDLDAFEDALPRNLDVVISWFGIRSWGARKGLRFVKALQRSGVKSAVFTSMCSNPGDEIDKPWTESGSKVTSFGANRRRRRNVNDCSQMVVYSLK